MGSFKKLTRQDVFVATYTAKKSWISKESEFEDLGIKKLSITSGSSIDLISGSTTDYQARLDYNSIRHLYYSNFSGSIISGTYDNYIQTSLETGSRELNNYGTVFSFSREVIGEKIDPLSFILRFQSGSISGSIIDDGEGKIYLSGSNANIESLKVGDIIYTHGLCIVSNTTASEFLNNTTNYTSSWDSNFTLYTLNVYCRVLDYEFNTTQNPTTVTGSSLTIKNFATGSDFRPYITGIGLYNPANQLIAVGKFGQPIPKTSDTDTVFVLKMDM